jgi:predicted transcriptional regulator
MPGELREVPGERRKALDEPRKARSASLAGFGVRLSVSLAPGTARRVKSLAESSHTSANRVLVDLIEAGLEAREQEKKRFLDLADCLAHARDPEEQGRLKEELARMTFGE